MSVEKARKTTIEVTYKGVNISADVAKDLVGFSFTDNESSKADDIDLTLQDRDGKWQREWFPTLGDKMTVKILYESNGRASYLECGTFELDEFTGSGGNGTTVSFKGVSVPQSNTVRRTKKNKAWEAVKLSEIAKDVAKTGELNLNYVTNVDPMFDRRDQNNKSDLEFLKSLCEEIALSIKVTKDEIVIFNRDDLEKNESIATIVFGSSEVETWSFTTQAHDTYSESIVIYKDPKTGKTTQANIKSKDVKSGKVLKQTKRVDNPAEAQRLAEAGLKNKNRKKTTGSISLIGNVIYKAGETIDILGFGKWDGKFYIEKATHDVSSGYTVSLDIASILNPKEDEKKAKAKKETKKKAERKKKVKSQKKTTATVAKKNLTEDEKWIMNN